MKNRFPLQKWEKRLAMIHDEAQGSYAPVQEVILCKKLHILSGVHGACLESAFGRKGESSNERCREIKAVSINYECAFI